MRPWSVSTARDGAAVVAELEARRRVTPSRDAHARARSPLRARPAQRGHVVGVAAALLVQHRGDALGLPVGEQALHVAHAVRRALDEGRLVADRLLLLVDRGDALVHHLRADLHVADRMVGIGLRVALPHADGMRHQLAHRGLEVVVADDAAGDAGGAGADPPLSSTTMSASRAAPLGTLAPGEVVGRRQAVDARADDDVAGLGGKRIG